MKENIQKEYYRRTRTILRAELNSTNRIKAINTLAIPVIKNSFNIINWPLEDLRSIDIKIRKLLTGHKIHIRKLMKTVYNSQNVKEAKGSSK